MNAREVTNGEQLVGHKNMGKYDSSVLRKGKNEVLSRTRNDKN